MRVCPSLRFLQSFEKLPICVLVFIFYLLITHIPADSYSFSFLSITNDDIYITVEEDPVANLYSLFILYQRYTSSSSSSRKILSAAASLRLDFLLG